MAAQFGSKLWKFVRWFVLIMMSIGLIGIGSYAFYYFYPPHYKDRVTVLEYHDISDVEGPYSITPEQFRGQLDKLIRIGAHFLDVEQFESFLAGGDVPDNAVFITFDDGYASYIHTALPILKEYQIPSVHFLITGTLEEETVDDGVFMSAEQVRETLAVYNRDAGRARADFGCHTHNSHSMVDGKGVLTVSGLEETAEQYRARVESDLSQCVSALEKLYASAGESPTGAVHMLTYPFGSFDQSLFATYEAAGIRYGFTGEPRLLRKSDNSLLIPRINAGIPQATPTRLQYWIKRGISRAPQW